MVSLKHNPDCDLLGMLVSGAVAAHTVVREIEALENTFHSTIRTVKTFNEFANVLVSVLCNYFFF